MKQAKEKLKKPHIRRDFLKEHIRQHKVVFAVYLILRFIVVALLVLELVQKQYESAFICVLVLVLFALPAFVQKNFGIQLPSTLEILILLFIFAAEILGELQSYYIHFAYWDTILHTTNGFVCAAFGFSLVDILCRNKQEKFRLSPLFMAVVAFCFSMTVGVLWEFFEYGMDKFAHTDMQKDTVIHSITTVELDETQSNKAVTIDGITSVVINGQDLGLGGYLDIGLQDTMEDLMVNFVGAVVFCFFGFFYIKYRGRGKASKVAAQFIPTIREEDTGDATDAPAPAE